MPTKSKDTTYFTTGYILHHVHPKRIFWRKIIIYLLTTLQESLSREVLFVKYKKENQVQADLKCFYGSKLNFLYGTPWYTCMHAHKLKAGIEQSSDRQ